MPSSWATSRAFRLYHEPSRGPVHEFQNWTQAHPLLSWAWAGFGPSRPLVTGFLMTLNQFALIPMAW